MYIHVFMRACVCVWKMQKSLHSSIMAVWHLSMLELRMQLRMLINEAAIQNR